MRFTCKDSEIVCPACYSKGVVIFYELDAVPVHSCLLMDSPEKALNYPRRDIKLGYCSGCGLVHNTVFDRTVHEYNEAYEETQGFSTTFKVFSNQQAQAIVDKFRLQNKKALEIGCGKGEFLYTLCKLAENQGIGIDPSYVPGRLPGDCDRYTTFIREFYQLKHGDLKPDFIFCRHTLEHIHNVREFMDRVHASTQGRSVDIWFDLPDAHRVWQEGAFWDVYYEHASYFSPGTVARLFRATGFAVTDLAREYDDQWISISGSSAPGTSKMQGLEDDLEETAKDVKVFQARGSDKIAYWRKKLKSQKDSGGRTVLWGGGSKAVAFVSTLGLSAEIEAVVDINPFKAGKFLPGSGHPVIAPAGIKAISPTLVIIMNPIYKEEIQETLGQLGVAAEVEACQ